MEQDKILAALVAISAQYNLPKSVLERIAKSAPKLETEDELKAWVESQKETMAMLQSYADTRVTETQKSLSTVQKDFEEYKKAHPETTPAPKVVPTGNSELDTKLAAMKQEMEASFAEKLKGYSELQTKYEELQKKQEESDKSAKLVQFTELKKRVASELGLSEKQLSMVEGKLSDDMDETKVNEILSQAKKDFQEMGIQTIETGSVLPNSTSEQAQKRANDYLDRLEKEQKAQQN